MSKGAQAFIGADEVQYSELRFWIFERSRNSYYYSNYSNSNLLFKSRTRAEFEALKWDGSVNSIRISIGTDWTSVSFEPEFFINSISLNC